MSHSRCLFSVFILFSLTLHSQIELPAFFGDNMVLQQNETVSIWGKDSPNNAINISSSWGEKTSAVADSEGFWFSKIKTKKGSFDMHTLKIEGSNVITLTNILIGEVWFCSGQSNMEMPLKGLGKSKVLNADKYLQNANNKNIRLFNNPRTASVTPEFDVKGKWVESNLESAKSFSAIGFIFGKVLYENLNVPIGIIESSWGGTKIESWIPKENVLKYENIKIPNTLHTDQNKQKKPTALYNAMIHPFQDFKIKGILWYQGESNRKQPSTYESYMKDLIDSWRHQWKDKNLPFYFVQIAPFNYVKNKNATNMGADFIREAQFKISQQIPNTGIVITTDAGDCNDIHPSKKEIVAKRLSKWALAEQYKLKDLNYKSAVLKKMSTKDDKIKLQFKFQKNDYFLKTENVKGFEIASQDKVFYPAQVSFSKNKKTLIIYSDQVKNPAAIRYGFEDCFESNLKTKSGLPISIFRTD
ncbi:sialate O-acetylesterase [uncultured Winogradskyella sp.]|uniref:sialate O-acetylesterase n=1 Tax=uncultured Winogradskyella sp. TaxID=395353 RepID=UPI00262BB686|nr:sialate O-acetylesterase [uncultured Winogradskyella sp.]